MNDHPDPDTPDTGPETVSVPIRRPRNPLGAAEYAEVAPEAAGQWDSRQWHDKPPL